MLALRYRSAWIAASVVLVTIVVWGSLQSVFGGLAVHGVDKFEHFGTYTFLALWFTGLYRRPHYWVIAGGLLLLGLLMEVCQFVMQAGRMGDPFDMAANACGIFTGLLLAWTLTGGWAEKVESWLGT
jgi:hypothetical protein